jgi:phage baseplate assembly protein V
MREEAPHDTIGELIRYGVVDKVDHSTGKIVVRVGEILTDDVRWLHAASGDTRIWSPPSIGEQVLLLAPEGDVAGAIALRGVHCNTFPPAGDSTRELIRFADGAVIAYDPESHTLEAILPAGATVSIVAPGGVTIDADVRITGDLVVDGDISSSGTVTGDVDVVGAGKSLKGHKHLGVQTGGGVSGIPQ